MRGLTGRAVGATRPVALAVAFAAVVVPPLLFAPVAAGGDAAAATRPAGTPGNNGPAPARVTDLAAHTRSDTATELRWTAVASGGRQAAATTYVVKRATAPIATRADFAAAASVCDGPCRLAAGGGVGAPVTVTADGLEPGTTSYYRVVAIDDQGRRGPLSNPAQATTAPGSVGVAQAPACPDGAPQAPFSDRGAIPDAHVGNVDCAFAREIVSGYADGTYRPGVAVRRDEMATFVVATLRAHGVTLPEPDPRRFTDVQPGSPHAEAVHRLAAAGIVSGGPGTRVGDTYGPARPLRRDQAASFVVRAAEYATDGVLRRDDAQPFADVSQANAHVRTIAVAAGYGLVQGFAPSRYGPDGHVRRDQMASLTVRLLETLADGSLRR